METHRLAPRWPEGCRKSWFHHSKFAKRSAFKQIPFVIDSSYIENSRATLRDSVIAAEEEEEEDTLSGQEPQGASSSSNRPRSPPGPPPRKRGSIARAEAIASQQPKAVSISAVPKNHFFRLLGVEHL